MTVGVETYFVKFLSCPKTNLQSYGKSTGQYTSWSKIESASLTYEPIAFSIPRPQGFQVSDEEIHMDLATFRSMYANHAGNVEYVLPLKVYSLQLIPLDSRGQLN